MSNKIYPPHKHHQVPRVFLSWGAPEPSSAAALGLERPHLIQSQSSPGTAATSVAPSCLPGNDAGSKRLNDILKTFIIGPMMFDTHAGSCMEISTD